MIICKHAADATRFIKDAQKVGGLSGYIPTMGALHEGHISLIKQSVLTHAFTTCSIFVNPTQFNNAQDFEKYPSTLSHDIDLLEAAGCELLFIPSKEEIYPIGFSAPHYELGFLETVFEGKFRPGHFQGVCMVVDRLLQIMQPNTMYLGQKDYQQCMVLSKMVADLGYKTKIEISPTLRDPDGLAMSSRNMRLSPAQRRIAPRIAQALIALKKAMHPGDITSLLKKGSSYLTTSGFRVDYFSVAHAENLLPVTNWDGQSKIVALVAAYLGEIRLIDNMLLN